MLITLAENITTEQKNSIRNSLYKDGCIVRDLAENGQNLIGGGGPGEHGCGGPEKNVRGRDGHPDCHCFQTG